MIDASVAVDLLAGSEESRVNAAEEVFSCLARGHVLYAPRLFLVEVAGVLARRLERKLVDEAVSRLRDVVVLVGDSAFYTEALEAAASTGSRGADAYYIGLARVLNAVLVTADRVQALNAAKAGVRAYYILDEDERRELLRLLDCRPGG